MVEESARPRHVAAESESYLHATAGCSREGVPTGAASAAAGYRLAEWHADRPELSRGWHDGRLEHQSLPALGGSEGEGACVKSPSSIPADPTSSGLIKREHRDKHHIMSALAMT